MNIFLITLLCYLFPFGPAELFQPSNNLTKCNAIKWDDSCNKTVVPLSNKSGQEDPWAGTNYVKSLSKQARDPWGERNLFRNKSNEDPWGRANLFRNKSNVDPWEDCK